jgi:hypothetical protein
MSFEVVLDMTPPTSSTSYSASPPNIARVTLSLITASSFSLQTSQ